MKLYLDTADPAETNRFLGTGLFEGVTCNPVILRAAGLGPSTAVQYHRTAVAAGARRVFLQTFGEGVDALVAQGLRYRDLGPEVVVKVVATQEGAAACAALRRLDVPVLLTAVHHAKQAITAVAAEATFVTPYLSEMYVAGFDAVDHVSAIQRIVRAPHSCTELLLAGVLSISTMVRYAEEGVEHMTISPDFARALFAEQHTEAMAELFDRATAESLAQG